MNRTLALALFLFFALFAATNANIIPKENVNKRTDGTSAATDPVSSLLQQLSPLLCPFLGSVPIVNQLLSCPTTDSGDVQSPLDLSSITDLLGGSGGGSAGVGNLLNLTNLLDPEGSLCQTLTQIPVIGDIIDGTLCKSDDLPPIDLPIILPTIKLPSGQLAPFSSLNAIACPVLTFINSVPLLGTTFVSSVNPPFFGCTITGNTMMTLRK